MDIERRDFLKIGLFTTGVLTGGSLWAKSGQEAVSDPIWEGPPGENREVVSVCQMCPNGCGIKVRIYEGRAVKIEGLPDHPLNKGSLCPRGQVGLRLLYHPDRLKFPMINKGGKGQGNWQRLTFEEVMGILAVRLQDLARNRSTHHLAIISAGFSDTDDFILDRFSKSFGTPNYVKIESLGRQAMSMAMGLTHGIYTPPAVDWANCDYLLLFGVEPGATDTSPMAILRSFGELRRGRAGRRAKIVHVGTRFSPFSTKVDERIRINPGTYGALALGIAYVIISEGKYDSDFIGRSTLGFHEVREIDGTRRPGFKDYILKNYSTQKTSSITGIPEKTIVRLAEEFASASPGVAYGGDGPASYSNSVTELVAIHCLNSLVGSIDVPGGVIIQRTPTLRMPADVGENSLLAHNLRQPRVDGRRQIGDLPIHSNASRLSSRLMDNSPYRVEMLMMVDMNPVEDLPDSVSWRRALSKIPFLVSFSNFIDESSKYADLIIPPGTFLERWDGNGVDSSTGFPVWSLSRPIFDTPFEGMDVSNFILKLTQRMGGKLANLFPWDSTEKLLREMAAGLRLSPGHSDPWDELLEKGYWSGGPYSFGHQRQIYKARGGRFNFFLYPLESAARVLYESGFKSPGATEDGLSPTDFLPNHISPEFSETGPDYPLHLELLGTTINGHGRFSFLGGLREIEELGIARGRGRWLLINPHTAEKLRLEDNTRVWVESSTNKIMAFVNIFQGMREDSVGMILGQGKGYDDSKRDLKSSPFSLMVESTSPIGGGYCWGETKVKIYRA